MLIETKITRPLLPSTVIQREVLLSRFDQVENYPLTLVSAAAGFGKTTAVMQWLSKSRVQSAWLSLDARDDDPTVFWQWVSESLARHIPRVEETVLPLFYSMGQLDIDSISDSLIHSLGDYARTWSCPDHFVLVLDDFHCIENPSILEGISRLIDYAPGFFHLVMTTRVAPNIGLGKLLVKNRLLQISVDQLRFSYEDATRLLRQRFALDLDEITFQHLYQLTEGWPAAIQLTAIRLLDHPNSSPLLLQPAQNELLGDYLLHEVFEDQSEIVQGFLLKVAQFDLFSVDFCIDILQIKQAPELLQVLMQKNLLITGFQQGGHYLYRMHELFREWLRGHSKSDHLDHLQIVRASDWYFKHGFMMEGLALLQREQCWEDILAILPEFQKAFMQDGQFYKVCQLMQKMPEKLLSSSPWALYLEAFILFSAGDVRRCEQYVVKSIKLTRSLLAKSDEKNTNHLKRLEAGTLFFHAQLLRMQGNFTQVKVVSAQINMAAIDDDKQLLAWVLQEHGGDAFLDGCLPAAQSLLVRSLHLAEDAGDKIAYVATLSWLMPCLINQAELSLAEVYLNEAKSWVHDDWKSHPLSATLLYFDSLILREKGDLSGARKSLREAFIKSGNMLNPFHQVYFNFHRWLLAFNVNDSDEAANAVATLDKLAKNYSSPWPFAVPEPALLFALNALVADSPMKMMKWAFSFSPKKHKGAATRRLVETLSWMKVRLMSGKDISKTLDDFLQETESLGQKARHTQGLLVKAEWQFKLGYQQVAADAFKQAVSEIDVTDMPQLYLDEMILLEPLLRSLQNNPTFYGSARYLMQRAFPGKEHDAVEESKSDNISELGGQFVEALSQRERETLDLLNTNRKNADIAECMDVSLATVKTHVRNLYSKLGVNSRRDALTRAKQLDLI